MRNALYCPDIEENIFYLYAQFPSWANLLLKAYNSPNKKHISAGVEEYFREWKELDWLKYPISAYKFVRNQSRTIEPRVSIAQAYLLEEDKKKEYESKHENPLVSNILPKVRKKAPLFRTRKKDILLNDRKKAPLNVQNSKKDHVSAHIINGNR